VKEYITLKYLVLPGKSPRIVNRHNVKEIIIAVPSADSKKMRDIVKYCQESNCLYKTMPGINDVADGRVTIKQVRSVEIDDLLGRERIDWTYGNSSYLAGKVIMITGAGGSIVRAGQASAEIWAQNAPVDR